MLKAVLQFCNLTKSMNATRPGSLVIVYLIAYCRKAFGLSDISPRRYIDITNPAGQGYQDRLPSSLISQWPTWVVDDDGEVNKVPDTMDGFIDPTSIEELWLPLDLKQPQVRISLGLHIREGSIRHLMPAIDVSYDGKHRNRGLCSLPRAHTWLDFRSLSLEQWRQYHLSMTTHESQTNPDPSSTSSWVTIDHSYSIRPALDAAISIMVGDPPTELASGSHILHIVIGNIIDCPRAGSDLAIALKPPELHGQFGKLQVKIVAVMAGSESQYMPEKYRPLFQDKSLQRSAYFEYKKRKSRG
jgi:hypothetical protein